MPVARGIATIKFRSSVNRSRDTSGHSIINGYRILKRLGSGTESSVRLGQSMQSGMQVSIYFQPLTDSRKGFTKHTGKFNHFQLLDKINLYAIPGTRRVLEIWYNKASCIQLHTLLVSAGVTFLDDSCDEATLQEDLDSTLTRTLFLIVEYCSSGGIHPIVGKLYYSEYIDFSRRLSYTIHRLHRAGIIHKDIKVDNILFSQDALYNNKLFYRDKSTSIDPYLIDFGISIDLDLLKTQVITIDVMFDRIAQMLSKDLGRVITLEWFDVEGSMHAIFTQNRHIEKLIKILVYYIKHFFTTEDLRILADPLISSNEKFITNKNGTAAYLPPEIRWENLLNSISDRPAATIRSNNHVMNRVMHALTDASALARFSANPFCDSFDFNLDNDDHSSSNSSEESNHQPIDPVRGQASQASLVECTISHSKAAKGSPKEFAAIFKKVSISNSFYAILPSPIDVWCFGITILYIMIGAARTEPLYRRSNDVLAISQNLTPFTTDLLCGCLALDPIERYTAEDISRHPLYIGYRVSYEEDNLSTYVSSVMEYRSLFGLPACLEGSVDGMRLSAGDELEQTSGNALENYHQYIMRKRRKTIISNNKRHIRRASLSSLDSVSHEFIFKEVYTDDTVVMALKLHNSSLFADPWLSSVLLQLDLTTISLQVRNGTVCYLHPQDFPDSRSYLVPKFFDVAYTLGRSQTIGQGLLSMKLKYLNYLATRLLGTTVYHNSLTSFKKHIMPEHIRGYTHSGALVPWVAGASEDGREWTKYRKCWGTKALERGSFHNESLFVSPEYLSTLILSSPEPSSSDEINCSSLEFDIQDKKPSGRPAIGPTCHYLATSKLQSVPKGVPIFDVHSDSQTDSFYGETTQNDGQSSQYKIAEEDNTSMQETTTCANDTTFTHDTSHDMFQLGLATPSEHHVIDLKTFAPQTVQPPSCELLIHKSQFIDITMVSHEVIAGHRHVDASLGRLKDVHPKSSNLICAAKLTTTKSSSSGGCQSSSHLPTKESQDQPTAIELERKRRQRGHLLAIPTTRTLAIYKSYATKHPVYDKNQLVINSDMLQGERPRDLQAQKDAPQRLNLPESKSMQNTSTSLNIHIGCTELPSHQSPDIRQVNNISAQHLSESTDTDRTMPHKLRSNIFNSQTILPDTTYLAATSAQIRSLVKLPNSSNILPQNNEIVEESSSTDTFEQQQKPKPPSSGALNAIRLLRNQLRNAIGDKINHTLDASGKIVGAVAPVTVKRVQFHCQRRYALFKKSHPKEQRPPLKILTVSQTPPLSQDRQDSQRSIPPQCSASASSSMLTFRHVANAAISLQTSDSTTTSNEVKSFQVRPQEKTSSTLKHSLLMSSANYETFDIDTPTMLHSEIDGCTGDSNIERHDKVPTSSGINASPFTSSSGPHTSTLIHGTTEHEPNITATSLRATSALSRGRGLLEGTSDEESTSMSSNPSVQTEVHLLTHLKATSQPILSHLPQGQPSATNSKDAIETAPIRLTSIPPKHAHDLSHYQHTKNMPQIEPQKGKQIHEHVASDTAFELDTEARGNTSSAVASIELISRSAYLSMQCAHKCFTAALKRRGRGHYLAKMLFKELEMQHPIESQVLAPKRFNPFEKTSQEFTIFEDVSANSSHDSSPIVPAQSFSRSKTLNSLIDLSDIESFDTLQSGRRAPNQKDKELGCDPQSEHPILRMRKMPSLNENIFKASWHHKDVIPVPTLPLVSTRNLGTIERVFMEEGAGSLDSSKLIKISRYDANNTNLKRAASYLRNSCASNITTQDTGRLRAFTCEISDTNNDEPSNEKPATSAKLYHVPIGQMDRVDEESKSSEDNLHSNISKLSDLNQHHSINTPISTLDGCMTSDERLAGAGESIIQKANHINPVAPIDSHRDESSLLVDSVLSVGYALHAGDEAIPFMNHRTTQGLDTSAASYITRDSANTTITCSTIVEDNEKPLSKSDELCALVKVEEKHPPLTLSDKIGYGGIEKKRIQMLNTSATESQSILEPRWKISSINPRHFRGAAITSSTVTDDSLATYVKGLPRFLNKFFPFSFTQSLFSSAVTAPCRLSGLLFAHYYTYMLPCIAEALDMFSKHSFMDVSCEYELSISVESAQEAVSTSIVNNPAPKAIVAPCRLMSNNKVLRSTEVATKKSMVKSLENLKLTDFSELFNDVSADEETHILELETQDLQYEGSGFLMDDCDSEA